MNSRLIRAIRFGLGTILLAVLTTACLIGGLMPSNNRVIIDETTVAPDLKQALASAKKLGFISAHPSTTAAATYLELHGGYEAFVEEPQKTSTPSQNRKLMETICSKSDSPDLVFLPTPAESDAGGMTTLKGAFTGRLDVNITAGEEVMRCKDKSKYRFSLRGELNQGIYNADQTKVNEIFGQEYAKALMRIAGKFPPVEGQTK